MVISMLYQYSKKDIKEAVKTAMKKEFLQEMQSSVKVSDRLSDDPEDNSYINKMSLPKVRVWSDIGQGLLPESKATLDILM